VEFRPTRAQLEAKARLLNKTKDNIMIGSLELMSAAKLAKYAGVKSVDHWLKQEGFKEWFTNSDSEQELLQSATDSAIRAAIGILENTEVGEKGGPKYSDQLNAAKLVLTFAGMSPKSDEKEAARSGKQEEMSLEDIDKVLAQHAAEREEIQAELSNIEK